MSGQIFFSELSTALDGQGGARIEGEPSKEETRDESPPLLASEPENFEDRFCKRLCETIALSEVATKVDTKISEGAE